MPGMNMPSMPFMSPMPNMLHDSMDLMRQNMDLFQQKASMMGMFPTGKEDMDSELSQSDANVSVEHRTKRNAASVKNGFNKSHSLQEEYKLRRKSLPSEHDLVPDFYDDSEGYSDFQQGTQPHRTSESETDVLSKTADEGYASYQKTYKDSQRDSVSSGKNINSKLENYTKSPPMRRKSLPSTPSEIVSEHENMFSSEVFAHPIHTNHSVPAFQTQKHQYRENVYKARVDKSNDLDESLYSIDSSDDDDNIFDSSLEGKLFVANCSWLYYYCENDAFVILTKLYYYIVYILS